MVLFHYFMTFSKIFNVLSQPISVNTPYEYVSGHIE